MKNQYDIPSKPKIRSITGMEHNNGLGIKTLYTLTIFCRAVAFKSGIIVGFCISSFNSRCLSDKISAHKKITLCQNFYLEIFGLLCS